MSSVFPKSTFFWPNLIVKSCNRPNPKMFAKVQYSIQRFYFSRTSSYASQGRGSADHGRGGSSRCCRQANSMWWGAGHGALCWHCTTNKRFAMFATFGWYSVIAVLENSKWKIVLRLRGLICHVNDDRCVAWCGVGQSRERQTWWLSRRCPLFYLQVSQQPHWTCLICQRVCVFSTPPTVLWAQCPNGIRCWVGHQTFPLYSKT